MRNLLLIHLESLNHINYHINKDMFPALAEWEKKSLTFPNYFSTATSTWMVIEDLMYGGPLQYEGCNGFGCEPEKYCYTNSLLDQLKGLGYTTKALAFGEDESEEFKAINKRNIVGFENKIELFQSYEGYLNAMGGLFGSGSPFALMALNFVSNVAANFRLSNGRFESGLDRWRPGYEYINNSVFDIIALLQKNHLLEKTTIVFYGDHGDDFFSHGYHGGLTHAIEPYANLIHTPLWIYDNRLLGEGQCDALISTTDIRDIAEALAMAPENQILPCGLNIPLRKFALSRNAYAAQPARTDSFGKGYSLTDGEFLILVSSRGLELYQIKMDPQCQNNLLNYFDYKQNNLYIRQRLNDSLGYHYKTIFNMSSIRQIRQTFYFLRSELYQQVLELYQHCGLQESVKELCFDNIHYTYKDI